MALAGAELLGTNVPVQREPVTLLFMPSPASRARTMAWYRCSTPILSNTRVMWLRTGKQRQVGITATNTGIDAFGKTNLAAGRPFTDAEATHNAPVMLVSHKLAVEQQTASY